MAIEVKLKSLLYKELQPMAKAAGCQIILLDASTYESWTDKLEQKMRVLGIEAGQYRQLIDAIQEYGYVAVLKSKKYYGPAEIAQFFSKAGLEESDVNMLNSTNAKHYEVWGDLDARIPEKKAMFFYWFAVDVENEDGKRLMESN